MRRIWRSWERHESLLQRDHEKSEKQRISSAPWCFFMVALHFCWQQRCQSVKTLLQWAKEYVTQHPIDPIQSDTSNPIAWTCGRHPLHWFEKASYLLIAYAWILTIHWLSQGRTAGRKTNALRTGVSANQNVWVMGSRGNRQIHP